MVQDNYILISWYALAITVLRFRYGSSFHCIISKRTNYGLITRGDYKLLEYINLNSVQIVVGQRVVYTKPVCYHCNKARSAVAKTN